RSRAPSPPSPPSSSLPARPPHITTVLAPSSAARSTLRSTLRSPKRRTDRSLAVNAPSLNAGWEKVFVVTISITRPASSVAFLKPVRIWVRVASSAPKGTTSSSWKVTPQAPSSASLVAYSRGSRAGRLASPNWSRAVQPTVHRPKENLSSGVGVTMVGSSSVSVVVDPGRRRRRPATLLLFGTIYAVAALRSRVMDRPSSRAARQESLREHNLALVAREVLSAARPLSRAEVAARTGLNRATVSRLVAELVAGRLVTEDTPVVSGAGRPATPLRPAPCTVGGLGLEVSLDFLGARVLDLAGQVVAEEVVAGDHRGSEAATVLAGLGGLAETVAARAAGQGTQVAGSALALPGLVAHSRLLVAPNLGWREVDPAAHLPDLPGARLRLDNEARL